MRLLLLKENARELAERVKMELAMISWEAQYRDSVGATHLRLPDEHHLHLICFVLVVVIFIAAAPSDLVSVISKRRNVRVAMEYQKSIFLRGEIKRLNFEDEK